MERYFCQKCLEATVANSKPRLCCHCGQSFALFVNPPPKPTITVTKTPQPAIKPVANSNTVGLSDEKRLSKLKLASHYRKDADADFDEKEPEDDDEQNEFNNEFNNDFKEDNGKSDKLKNAKRPYPPNSSEDLDDFRGNGELSASKDNTNEGPNDISSILTSLLVKPRKQAVSMKELLKENKETTAKNLETRENQALKTHITEKKTDKKKETVRISLSNQVKSEAAAKNNGKKAKNLGKAGRGRESIAQPLPSGELATNPAVAPAYQITPPISSGRKPGRPRKDKAV